ncbi:uncharacterized protein LOC108674214 [Hyalella azteca]|uniref:Uncharacterized protein LOC108674214 n=1 Tax=Hyalella azteca TaxID=294128 RepID=A0A8B7NV39_HYAAZ|nr:uncharacterized protein LOC108674214 [Hyalella azteca]
MMSLDSSALQEGNIIYIKEEPADEGDNNITVKEEPISADKNEPTPSPLLCVPCKKEAPLDEAHQGGSQDMVAQPDQQIGVQCKLQANAGQKKHMLFPRVNKDQGKADNDGNIPTNSRKHSKTHRIPKCGSRIRLQCELCDYSTESVARKTSKSIRDHPGSEETSVDAEQLPVTKSLKPIRNKMKVESDFHQNFLDLEKEKLELLRKDQSNETDDCRQFLLSLVPSMKNMTLRNQCMFRMKVLKLVFQFLHGEDQHL